MKGDNMRDAASEQEARSMACPPPIGAPMLVCITSNISKSQRKYGVDGGRWTRLLLVAVRRTSGPEFGVRHILLRPCFPQNALCRLLCCVPYLRLPGLVS